MRNAFGGAGKAGAKLDPGCAHFQIGGNRFAPADAARDEHRHLGRHFGQDFLRQHAGRDRADMAASLHPFHHQRVDARPHQLLRQAKRGGEADQLGPFGLDRFDAALGRQATGQHDMADVMARAHVDQIEQHRVHGDEVDAEGLVRQRLGRGDFPVQQVRRHRPAGDDAKAARIGYGRHQMAFGNPAHRPAQDRAAAAEKVGAARHEGSEFGVGHMVQP